MPIFGKPSQSRLDVVISRTLTFTLIFGFLACTGLIDPVVPVLQFGWVLTMGWIAFLKRVSLEMTISTVSIEWFVISLALLMLVGHRIATWLVCQPPIDSPSMEAISKASRWPIHRTVLLQMVILVSFMAGICLVGITHEMIWIMTAKTPTMLINSGYHPARRTQSKNNLKQLGLAFHNFLDNYSGFPESMTFDDKGKVRHGWVTQLLPYLDQVPLYNKVHFKLPWNAAENRIAFESPVPVLVNPGVYQDYDKTSYAPNHYAGNSRLLRPGRKTQIREITDGSSNTILAGEVNSDFQPWGKPGNCRDPQLGIDKSAQGFGSPFAGGTHFLLADGSVRFVSMNVNPEVIKALSTPNGGETVPDF